MVDRIRSFREHHGDEGYSLPELMVVLLLFAIVSVALFSSLVTMTNASTTTQNRSEALASNRLALETIVRDLRAANPIDPLNNVTEYPTKVKFSVYCSTPSVATGCSTDNLREIVYDVVDYALRRTVAGQTTVLLGPSGPTGEPRNRQRSAIVNPSTIPPFAYLDENGAELPATGSALNFRNCTKAVRVRLAVVASNTRPDTSIDLATTVNLRNYNKVSNCTV